MGRRGDGETGRVGKIFTLDNQASRIQAPGFIRGEIKNLYPIEDSPNLSRASQCFNSKI